MGITRIDRATDPPSIAAIPFVLVIGNFDGVHRGHSAVLAEAVEEAKVRGLLATVLTFDPHPAVVLGRGRPPVVTTLERRAELIGKLGISRVFVWTFDKEFAEWSPEKFARELVSEALMTRVVVV